MKHRTLPLEKLTLERLLKTAARTTAVFLSRKGRVRFVLLRADDGDQEVYALRNNPKFMAYPDECIERAKLGPTYTHDEVLAHFGLDKKPAAAISRDRNGSTGPRAKPRRTA